MKDLKNADKLWSVLVEKWPEERDWLTVEETQNLIPRGTGGVKIPSLYDFAILTLLGASRRHYVLFEDAEVQATISDEVVKTNRNNGIWRKHLRSKVKRVWM